jgi:ketosteroid isomerase-like protein
VNEKTQHLSFEEVREMMDDIGASFASADAERILSFFDNDVTVVFADFPPMLGKAAYADFLRARLARQVSYVTKTRVHVVSHGVIGASWEATWRDAETGYEMAGRGCECVHMVNGKITEFHATFNVWRDGAASQLPIV